MDLGTLGLVNCCAGPRYYAHEAHPQQPERYYQRRRPRTKILLDTPEGFARVDIKEKRAATEIVRARYGVRVWSQSLAGFHRSIQHSSVTFLSIKSHTELHCGRSLPQASGVNDIEVGRVVNSSASSVVSGTKLIGEAELKQCDGRSQHAVSASLSLNAVRSKNRRPHTSAHIVQSHKISVSRMY